MCWKRKEAEKKEISNVYKKQISRLKFIWNFCIMSAMCCALYRSKIVLALPSVSNASIIWYAEYANEKKYLVSSIRII